MPESWDDLIQPIGDVQPPMDLWPAIERRAAAQGRVSPIRVWRPVIWLAAAAGAALIIALLILAAHSAGRNSQVGSHPKTGSVSGVVRISGGTAIPPNGNVHPARLAPFIITGRTADGRHIRRSITTDSDGRFSLPLPPGRYWVTWAPGRPLDSGFTVSAGRTTTVHLLEIAP